MKLKKQEIEILQKKVNESFFKSFTKDFSYNDNLRSFDVQCVKALLKTLKQMGYRLEKNE